MLNKHGERELAYLVTVDAIEPITGSDNCECSVVGGWRVMTRKGTFKPGDVAVYFEIDSVVDYTRPEFAFLASRKGKIKTQRYTFGGKGLMISQGLLMSPEDFGWENLGNGEVKINSKIYRATDEDTRFLTSILDVRHIINDTDRVPNVKPIDKYKQMAQRHYKLFRKPAFRWLMRRDWGKKLLFIFLGHTKKKAKDKGWPVGMFPGVSKTDQERCENMPHILNDKTPYIKTQKCDGSSGTYILARKKNKFSFIEDSFEFYVCSRNVRMLKPEQECFYGEHNYYWEVAEKYKIEKKMKDYLTNNPDISFVCWQGEICAPAIQKNPHNLKETHFYCFHMTDSKNGRYDIREAAKIWQHYMMEVVPIVDTNYIMPDDFEEFKLSADGVYDSDVCEGHIDCPREGFVYYKTTDPTFSFKNVSRQYLLGRKE